MSTTHSDVVALYDIIAPIILFLHVPDFRQFCSNLTTKVIPGMVLFMEVGNGRDLERRKDYPDEPCLPAHLVFDGQEHVRRFLRHAGV